MTPPATVSAILPLSFLLLLAATIVDAQSESNYIGVLSGNCTGQYNKESYCSDPAMEGTNNGANAAPNWPKACRLPSKRCDCVNSSYEVGPWAIYSKFVATTNNKVIINTGAYLSAADGSQQNKLPYMHGSSMSRQQCCSACAERNKYSATESNYPNGTKVYKCQYWQHYYAGSGTGGTCASSSACGYCIFWPVGAGNPMCNNGQGTDCSFGGKEFSASLYSAVGKGCPGGKNDPHFVGAKGTHFDFNGVPDQSFCLITDKQFQINMKMRGYYDERTVGASVLSNGKAVRTWIKDLGIIWFDAAGVKHSFKMSARDGKSQARDEGFVGGMEMNGAAVSRIRVGDTARYAGGLEVQFIGFEKQGGGFFDVDVYEVRIPGLLQVEVKLRIAHPLLQTPTDAMTHINVKFIQVEHTEVVHGVLGQTFREGREKRAMDYTSLATLLRKDIAADSEAGKGFLDGSGSDYQVTDVLSSDCQFSAFGSQELPSSV